MRARLAITFLLIVSMTTPVLSRPVVRNGASTAQQVTELTPEEKQAALDLAARFAERLRATHDFGPIVDEMFVRDFPERLQKAPQDWLPWYVIDKSLLAQASPDELRRFYIAAMNFYWLWFQLHDVAELLKKQSGDGDDELEFEEIVSPEVVGVLLSNPLFAEYAKLAEKEERDEQGKEDDNGQPAESSDSAQAAGEAAEADNNGSREKSESGIIKSVEQLNGASATLEKASELMRKRLASMSYIRQATPDNDEEESFGHVRGVYPDNLDEGEFGYPKGTPVIHLDVLPLCLRLIKVDGQLKILAVGIYVD